MAESTVTADLHETSDVAIDFSAKVSFHLELAVNDLSEVADLGFREVANLFGRINSGLRYQIMHIVLSNAI